MLEVLIVSSSGPTPFVPPPVLDGSIYKGFVKSADFIGGNALAGLVGLTSGTAFNDDGGWLKFIDGEVEFYIPRKPFRYGMTVAALKAAGGRTGNRITIGGSEYDVTLMTGMSTDNFASIISVPSGGDWDKYMYPMFKKIGGQPTGAQWAEYTTADLGMSEMAAPNKGTISVCFEQHNTITTALAARGFDYSGGASLPSVMRKTVINDASPGEGNAAIGVTSYGWRPKVVKVPPPPTIVDTWETVGPMPVQRSRFSAVEIGGLVYLFGGYNESTVIQGTLHSFNPATKAFTALAAGQPRGFHDAVAINGKMYVFGGLDTSSNFTTTVQCYDPATNTWTYPTVQGATLTGRARHKMVVDGTAFMIIAGVTTGGSSVPTIQRYDTVTQQASNVPGTVGAALFGVADTGFGTVYTSGGYVSAPGTNFDAVVLSTGAITARAALPSSRYSHVSFYAKSGVYMIGGTAGTPADSTKVMRYTPGTNTWATLGTIPYTVGDNAAVAKVGTDVYLFGGNGAAGAQAWKYTP